jgi:hypothetical protein
MTTRSVYCSPTKLREFFMVNNTNYVIINDKNIPGFWESTSKFLCTTNPEQLSKITESISNDFALPNDVKEVRIYDF